MFNRLFVSLTLVQLRSRGFLLSRGELDLRRVLRLFCFAVFLVPLLLCFPVIVYAQPDSTQEVYEYVMQWGSLGSGDGQFYLPAGSCFDPSGYLYVCDRNNNRIQKFDRNGNFILKWGSYGRGQGQFDEPFWVTADRSGHVFIDDGLNNRIQVFDTLGSFVRQWYGDTINSKYFHGISYSPSGRLYVARSPDSLFVFDTLGNVIRRWGNADPRWWPAGVAVDDSEHIFVSQSGVDSNYIQKFDSLGTPLLKWGGWGSGNGQFAYVYQLAIGDSGKVFATDGYGPVWENHRMQKFTSGGRFVTTWGTLGAGNGEFDQPYGVAVDREGYVYVSDASLYNTNNRIQKFRKTVVGVTQDAGGTLVKSRGYGLKVLSPVHNEFVMLFSLPREGVIRIGLHDVSGRKLFSLFEGLLPVGEHELRRKINVPSGVYFVVLEGKSGRKVAKVLSVR